MQAETVTGRWLIVAAVMVASALAALEQSVVFTAMPTIVGALGGMDLYSWTFTAFMCTATLTTPLYGKLADLYGRKRVLQAAVLLFVAGSAALGLSQSMPQLILFRAIQGLGAGGIVPVALTIFGDLFSVEQRARYTGLLAAVWGFGALFGPAMGSLIISTAGWRWVFAINVPIGLVCMVMVAVALRESQPQTRPRLDWQGALLLSASVSALLLALAVGGAYRPWADPMVLGFFLAALLALVGFVRWEQRAPEPLVPLDLFRIRLVAACAAASGFFGIVLMGMSAFVPLLVQGALGASVFVTALAVAAQALAWPCGATLSSRLVLRYGYRPMTVAGQALQLIAALGLLFVAAGADPLWVVLLAAVAGFGFGSSHVVQIISSQNAVAWQQRGVVTSTHQFLRNIGQTVGGAVLGTLLANRLAAGLAELPIALQLSRGAGGRLEGASALLDPGQLAALSRAQVDLLRAGMDRALDGVFLVVALAGALALASVLLIPRGLPADLDYRATEKGSALAEGVKG